MDGGGARICPCSRVPAERRWGPPSQVDEGVGVLLMSLPTLDRLVSWQEGTRTLDTPHREPCPFAR
jgi:hypothetical protein